MTDFIVLREYQGNVSGRYVRLPAGKVVSDVHYDIAQLLLSGLRAIEIDPSVVAVLKERSGGLGDVAAAALETLFGITPPPSISPVFGSYSVSSSAQTTMNPGTPVKMAGTTTASITVGLTHSDNRITNSGAVKVTLGMNAALTLESTSNNRIVSGFFAKNGTVIAGSEIRTKVGTGTDEEEMTVFAVIELDPSDFVEIFLDISAAGDLTATFATIMAQGFAGP